MTGYHDVRYAIENSRVILPDYRKREIPKLYGEVLFEKVVDELEVMIQAPRGLILTKVLSALSIGLQHLVDVQTPDGRVMPAACYFITIAKTGERKSGVESKVYQPIDHVQKELDEIYAKCMGDYRRNFEIFEEKQKVLKKELRKSVAKGECSENIEMRLCELTKNQPYQEPKIQMIYTDVTSEALIDDMSSCCKYVAIASGEGGAVLKSSAIKDYPMLNSMWGGEPVKKGRKTVRSNMVSDGRLTLSLDVQPEVFDSYLQKHGNIMQASGFFARCFMAQPNSNVGSRFYMKTDIDDQHYQKYVTRLKEYLSRITGVLSGSETRRVIKLTDGAENKMISIINAVEYELNPGGFFCNHEGYGSKHADKILRLACLLNVFEDGLDSDIHEGAVDHALHLSMYFASQHCEIFKYISQEEKEEEVLLSWISRKRQKGTRYIKKNDIRRGVSPILRNSEKLNATLERLESRDDVRSYMAGETECVDLMPWLPIGGITAQLVGRMSSSKQK